MKNESKTPEKYYTYSVSVFFKMQFTFNEKEVQSADGGDENDLDPTDQALFDLKKELEDYLSQNYTAINKLEVCANFDNLLGVYEEEIDD